MSSPLLLAVDIGNTATTFGIFRLGSSKFPKPPFNVTTTGSASLHRKGAVRRVLRRFPLPQIKGVVISSVVPSLDAAIRQGVKVLKLPSPLFISARTPMKLKIRYRAPREVGADRLVNARAAMALTKGPSVVVDFGTATTFDCTTAWGEYLGGVIAPGPVISAEALYQRTAKLPRVLLEKPVTILGKNTLESIQAGLYHGYRGLVKEIIERLKGNMGKDTKVFATGGQARWILKGVSAIDRHVPHLTLAGLYLLWNDNH